MKHVVHVVGSLSLLAAGVLVIHGCGGGSSEGSGGSAPVTVAMQANFTPSAAPKMLKLDACPQPAPENDGPEYAAGPDCDSDNGIIAYLTPQSFKVALKRLSFYTGNGEQVDFVADRGTLAQSLVFDLTQPITVSQLTIPAADYATAEAEVYYYEITMPLNIGQEMQTIRVYLSDDDFPAEGSLGHHQGDITFIDTQGNEMGWVGVGTQWTDAALQTDASNLQRPGAIDPETQHQRGHFGNSALWDQEAFVQGSGRDVFLMEAPLGLSLTAEVGKTVTFTFDVADTWFWEDFDRVGGVAQFNPCENGTFDACDGSAAWAPLFNLPVLTVE